ncbi:MAG: hypothetical protein AAF970_06895 [Bacteroidota bacterium]
MREERWTHETFKRLDWTWSLSATETGGFALSRDEKDDVVEYLNKVYDRYEDDLLRKSNIVRDGVQRADQKGNAMPVRRLDREAIRLQEDFLKKLVREKLRDFLGQSGRWNSPGEIRHLVESISNLKTHVRKVRGMVSRYLQAHPSPPTLDGARQSHTIVDVPLLLLTTFVAEIELGEKRKIAKAWYNGEQPHIHHGYTEPIEKKPTQDPEGSARQDSYVYFIIAHTLLSARPRTLLKHVKGYLNYVVLRLENPVITPQTADKMVTNMLESVKRLSKYGKPGKGKGGSAYLLQRMKERLPVVEEKLGEEADTYRKYAQAWISDYFGPSS